MCDEKSPRRKSKRRSSFAASRINILQKETSEEELYKDIDSNKPPDERLILLTKACLQYTLKKMEKEMTGCRDFETYKREVEEAVLRKIADMEVNGLFKEATEKERTLPNPINAEMDNAIENLKDKISRLKEESSKWDELITKTEEKISEYERLSQTSRISENEIPDTIKHEAGPYLRTRLDYRNLLSEIDQSCKKTCLKVLEHAKIVGKLNTAFQHTSSRLNKHMDEIKELQKPVETPRRVIQSLMSFPTPSK